MVDTHRSELNEAPGSGAENIGIFTCSISFSDHQVAGSSVVDVVAIHFVIDEIFVDGRINLVGTGFFAIIIIVVVSTDLTVIDVMHREIARVVYIALQN
uniref:Uncharacterized protein n=1 Tax=Romanomermis culicivorax TaxID=13658 RepID=A0A915IMP9_ROMCU